MYVTLRFRIICQEEKWDQKYRHKCHIRNVSIKNEFVVFLLTNKMHKGQISSVRQGSTKDSFSVILVRTKKYFLKWFWVRLGWFMAYLANVFSTNVFSKFKAWFHHGKHMIALILTMHLKARWTSYRRTLLEMHDSTCISFIWKFRLFP